MTPADSSSNDSLRVEASASSFALEVKGGKAASATTALIDIVSPFTQALGWVGDQFSHARKLAAIRAASKAAEQLRAEGVSGANIPPKVFLPWLEGASLETDQNESLTDAWAGLFVRAAKSSDAVTISYIETLKRLGKREAELLQFFATDTSPFYSEKFYGEDLGGIFSDSNPLRGNLIRRLDDVLGATPTVGALREVMEDFGIQGMCQVIFFSTDGQKLIPTNFFRDHEHVIANLEHLGLITIKPASFESKYGMVDIKFFEITKYAFDLIWACQGTLTGRKARDAREKNQKSKSVKE